MQRGWEPSRLLAVLDGVIPVVLGACVVGFVLGSSWSSTILRYAHQGRWVVLFVLFCLSALWAVLQRDRRIPPLYYGTASLLLLAFVSRFWSMRPRLTDGRSSSLALLFLTAALLIGGVAARPRIAARVLLAILVATDAVALAGLGALLVARHSAYIGTTLSTFRLQGIGQNPNTVSMLAALALPIAAAFWWRSPRGFRRSLSIASCLLLGLTIVLSQSDGAALAAAVGLACFGLLAGSGWLRRLTIAATALAVVGGVVLYFALPPAFKPVAVDPSYPYVSYEHIPSDSEIGWPGPNGRQETRVIFTSGGRVDAWRDAIRQADERPLLGYGFGTEDKVFVDREYSFQSARPENSYVGLYLQLGLAGLAVLGAIVALLAAGSLRGLRAGDADRRFAVVVTSAVVLAGLTVAVVQSYLYSAGNVAALPFWVCAFLLARLAVDAVPAPARELATPARGRERVAVS